ncbi:MAG: outer membrane beta-barrel protein [Deltaproteobacteria bacterium]|nr:outer membrane beta-barrel protein [Deltaproteobacteria bacterium]NIS77081.1 outer membrane beta-barrel protein [Deltaproteobacteria bacterium]
MSKKTRKIVLLMVLSMFLSLFAFSSDVAAGSNSGPWTFRGSFVYISPDSDWDPIDELYGFSAEVLYDVGPSFRIGPEINYATGDEDLFGINFEADWLQVLARAEYFIGWGEGGNNSFFLGLGAGMVNVDGTVSIMGLSASEDDTSFAFKPFAGCDIFFSDSVGISIQAGYLWAENTIAGIDVDSTGFEGKIGIVFAF